MYLDLKNKVTPPAKPFNEDPPMLELNSLPSYLYYSFLGSNNTLSIIIAVDFVEWQIESLVGFTEVQEGN